VRIVVAKSMDGLAQCGVGTDLLDDRLMTEPTAVPISPNDFDGGTAGVVECGTKSFNEVY
jgi:hypothetical protein